MKWDRLKQTLKWLIIVSVIGFTGCSTSPETKQEIAQEIKQSNIDDAIQYLTPRAEALTEKTGIPGMAIAVVHGDKIIYARGFGVRRVGSDQKVDADTVFLLASVSKSLAATVVAKVTDRGEVSWNDPVAKYIPGFTLKDHDVGKAVTIADMFAHRSGLPDHAGDLLEDLGFGRDEIIERLRFLPLHPFLVTFRYTNFGLTAGAQAVANAQGITWEDLSQRELYEPLGMNSTSSRWMDYYNRPNRADIHVKDEHGNWRVSVRRADQQSPAGGVSSSVNDVAKWMMLMVNDGVYQGNQIISKTALNELHKLPQNVAPLVAEKNQYYALGMNVSHDDTGRMHLSHAGAFFLGTSTIYELLPSERLGIVILTNGAPKGVADAMAKEFYDIVLHDKVKRGRRRAYAQAYAEMSAHRGELVGKKRPTNPTPALSAKHYTGTYYNDYFGRATVKTTSAGLSLVAGPGRLTFPRTFPLTHWDGNTFSFKTMGENSTGVSALTFTPTTNDHVTSMTIEWFNQDGLGTFVKKRH